MVNKRWRSFILVEPFSKEAFRYHWTMTGRRPNDCSAMKGMAVFLGNNSASVGSYVNALAESISGLYKADVRKLGFGWGTWIRTKTVRVRVGSSTVKLSPKRQST